MISAETRSRSIRWLRNDSNDTKKAAPFLTKSPTRALTTSCSPGQVSARMTLVTTSRAINLTPSHNRTSFAGEGASADAEA